MHRLHLFHSHLRCYSTQRLKWLRDHSEGHHTEKKSQESRDDSQSIHRPINECQYPQWQNEHDHAHQRYDDVHKDLNALVRRVMYIVVSDLR